MPARPIFLVDDEEQILLGYDSALRLGGFDNLTATSDSREVSELLKQKGAAVVLLDLTMPHIAGDQLLRDIKQSNPGLPVIVITGNDSVEVAVQCMKDGAFDFLVKPVEKDRLVTTVRRALSFSELSEENLNLKERILKDTLEQPEAFREIVTNNAGMHKLFKYIEAIAKTSQPVLIMGETGVGKELIARAVHRTAGRQGEFVAVNLAGLDDNVFSDTLFGHTAGAFTGADRLRKGLIEKAAGGTLFLDEIGDLNISSQVKLLRLLQEREYFPLGSDVFKYSDARIVVATNCDLDALQEAGSFRKDLYYRLRAHQVYIPPLRERLDDLPLLLEHFLEKAANDLDKKRPRPPSELLALLASYSFPGNVRELHTMVFDAVSRHTSMMLSMDAFKEFVFKKSPQDKLSSTPPPQGDGGRLTFGPKLPTIEEAKDLLIDEALTRTGGNKSLSAEILGITRQALGRRVRHKGQ